jgi:DNA-binding transcriptional ArsR family regulator
MSPDPAPVFAALGDPVRLALVGRLAGGQPRSLTDLAADQAVSRQAVTKHLRVLERAGLAHSRRAGRATVWQADPAAIRLARDWLADRAALWDSALSRLRAHVEGG